MLIAWWNPLESIGNALASFFTGILLFLDSIVYSLISWVYQIILVLCRVDILDNTFSVDALINRIYIIIGVVVLFLLAYSLLRSMVNPDDAVKGKKSPATIIKDVIISIVLIALIPTIFSFAMRFQTSILENNTIGKLILGTTTTIGNQTVSSEDLIQRGGIEIASNVLRAFLHPNYANCEQNANGEYDCSNIEVEYSAYGVTGTDTFDAFWESMINRGSLTAITDLADNIVDGGVTYYYIISTIAGVCVLIVMISYCFDVALRLVKLAVFQLIAPLPILARIMPGEQGNKVFSNWLKATISTYVEVFIRLAILFFGVLIINIVVQNFTTIFNDVWTGSDALTIKLFAQLFIILGIILFIQQAPKILKDITGLDSGKYNVFGSAFKAAAMLGGGVTAAVRNWNDKENIKGNNAFTRGFNRVRSSLGGAGSAMLRSTMGRENIKDFKSMRANARDSANKAFQAHQERIAYAKSHPEGVLQGHIADQWDKVKYWAHGDVDDKRLQSIVDIAGKVGKGANDSIEDLLAMINGKAKEQKRQLDALKNKTVEISDYFDSVMIDGKIQYVAKGTNLNDPNIRNKAITAEKARQIAQEANTTLYKSAKDEFEKTYSRAISSLYTVDLNDRNANIQTQKELWGLQKLSDDEARAQLQGFKNQISSRLNTLSLDQAIAKQTDVAFNALKSLNINDIVEQLVQNEAENLRKQGISFDVNALKEKYSADTDAIATQLISNLGANKGTAGEIQRDAEFKTAEAKVRNSKLNNDKKD